MRSTVILVAALGVAAIVAAVALGGRSAAPPRLSLASDTVRGMHFAPRELVRLSFAAGPAPLNQRRVRTNAAGAFSLALPVVVDPCVESLAITARGARGDSARLKLPQRACPMP
jgi:hypothetical protein